MTVTRRTTFAVAAGFVVAMMGSASFAADTTIKVSLWDKGPDSAAMVDSKRMLGMGKMMMGDMKMAMMGISIDKVEVPAGKVTFAVTNDSTSIIHEMVVSPVASASADMPYLDDMNKIDEEAAGHVGEVAELDPGKSGALTVDLKPGIYVLYCNIPGHYVGGLWTILTVTE